jgi:Flp pilus assembly protein TadB
MSAMRVKNFQQTTEERKEKFWRRFWVCWMIASFVGWWWYRPIIWLALIPTVRFMFSDWKKENERINQELENPPMESK